MFIYLLVHLYQTTKLAERNLYNHQLRIPSLNYLCFISPNLVNMPLRSPKLRFQCYLSLRPLVVA